MPHDLQLVILDRDGVINKEQGHITSVERFQILDGVSEAIAALNAAGIKVCVASNQSGLARGILSEETLAEIQASFTEELTQAGGEIEAWFYSPWHPDTELLGGVQKWLGDHEDRKPGAGMLRKALQHTKISAENALMVGDSKKDFLAASFLGMPFYGIKSAKQEELDGQKAFDSLQTLVTYLLS